MARTSREMADKLIEIYQGNERRYRLSHDAFKDVAGKTRLRDAYLAEVDGYLREDGYVIIDLRAEHGCLVTVRQKVPLKYDDLSDSVDDHVYNDDEVDEE